MKRTDDWANTPNDLRNRPQIKLTLAPATIAILDALARRWGIARSRVVDRLAQSAAQLNGNDSE